MKTECEYLYGWIKDGHIGKHFTENGEPERFSWEGRRRRMVNPRAIAGKVEEEEW